ncbi:hypothetical protein ACFFIF_08240 [Vagococcus entomophilus]|uniref:Uncharacterized protein n=1 Tax=Vagococcus entomophilus TaxID=1160095 RepID=A0A430AH62_9ENTE|nr:hypothetical protein [Vagococcus entomophilus]RSU07250.1 hypothetical protein CBF30_08325 [Vagococcus entomophilus]
MEKQTTSSSTVSTVEKLPDLLVQKSAVSRSMSEISQSKEEATIISKVKDYVLNQQSDKNICRIGNWSPVF